MNAQWKKNTQLINTNVYLYAETSLDFVDCLLVAYHSLNNENMFSFDKKLSKYLSL